MNPELEQNRQAVIQACERFGVNRLYVFGSSLREDLQPGDSDIDLLVEFAPDESYALVDAYFGLLDELRSLSSSCGSLTRVVSSTSGISLRTSIQMSATPSCGSSPSSTRPCFAPSVPPC